MLREPHRYEWRVLMFGQDALNRGMIGLGGSRAEGKRHRAEGAP